MPYATHPPEDLSAMLDAVGVDDPDDLFDIPASVRFEGDYGIESHTERETREAGRRRPRRLHGPRRVPRRRSLPLRPVGGRPPLPCARSFHLLHAVPARGRTGLPAGPVRVPVARGRTHGARRRERVDVRPLDGAWRGRVARQSRPVGRRRHRPRPRLAPRPGALSPENYTDGPGIAVETYPTEDGTIDVAGLEALVDDGTLMVYAATPNDLGVLESDLDAVGDVADDVDALFCVGSDLIALSGAGTAGGLRRRRRRRRRERSRDADELRHGTGESSPVVTTSSDRCRAVWSARARTPPASEPTPSRSRPANSTSAGNAPPRTSVRTRRGSRSGRPSTPRGSVPTAWWTLAEECIAGIDELCARVDDLDGYSAPVYDGPHFREGRHRDRSSGCRSRRPVRARTGSPCGPGPTAARISSSSVSPTTTAAPSTASWGRWPR